MNNLLKRISIILMLCLTITLMSGCGDNNTNTGSEGESQQNTVDYAGSIQFDDSSNTAKAEVTVKTYVDGDTTHFHVPTDVMPNGVLKARYLGINTPESTGKIEEYGKKASRFTREKLENATSIIIESDDANWNADSTGDRYLVWVWYKTADSEEYRNLNVEILQNGLAIANASGSGLYGSTCTKAINQAKAEKLNVYSGQKDPDYYYGDTVELTLKELRTNTEAYSGMRVAFNGIITTNDGNRYYCYYKFKTSTLSDAYTKNFFLGNKKLPVFTYRQFLFYLNRQTIMRKLKSLRQWQIPVVHIHQLCTQSFVSFRHAFTDRIGQISRIITTHSHTHQVI
jgi:micrococcal nuclease